MADVFISYTRDDQPKARQLAETLTAHGWDVWWDLHITPGHVFSESIQHELDGAACVVVLWSKGSIASEYVRDEAGEARDRNALVPVLIEDVRPPLGFRQRQVVNLTGWSGNVEDPEYLSLIGAIERLVPPPANAGAKAEPPPRAQPPVRSAGPQHAKALMAGVVAAARRLSRRTILGIAAAIVLVLALMDPWYRDWWSGTPRGSYRVVDVDVKLGDWRRVRALYGTAAFYRAVRPSLVLGRHFSTEEMWSERGRAPNVVLLNEKFWRRELDADPSFIERALTLKSYGFNVRGVVALPSRWDSIDILFPHRADQAPDF